MRQRFSILFVFLLAAACVPGPRPELEPTPARADLGTWGQQLFVHSWTPDDPLSVDGNGLGPYYNATSCAGCHSQGGVGGAGGNRHNVRLEGGFVVHKHWPAEGRGLRAAFRNNPIGTPGFVGGGGLGLSTRIVRGRAPPPEVAVGSRNTPALFGAGLIDALDEAVIVAGAKHRDLRFPAVQGQVGRTADGRVGRFGWKGDVASLSQFVSQACANEVGLTVPAAAEPQPRDAETSPGLDLDAEDVEALVSFVSALPRPTASTPTAIVEHGRRVFGEVGCTACHRPNLGSLEGVYSDLLLHDLGSSLADQAGGYYGGPVDDVLAALWRTPPLWGLRDSGPYLHDGRAPTVIDAITRHRGTARASREQFSNLPAAERDALLFFLDSLTAPVALPGA